jgi:uncharacterized protein (DUF736 family)
MFRKVKSMNIGDIRSVNGRLEGRLATRTIDLPRIGMRPVESTNPRAPVYEILALNVARRWVQVGVLWQAFSKKTGEAFLAGNIDDPSLPEPLPVAFFHRDDGGFNIAWRRDNLRSDFGGTGFGPSNYDSMGPDRAEAGEDEDHGFGSSTAGNDGRLMSDEEEPFEPAFAS